MCICVFMCHHLRQPAPPFPLIFILDLIVFFVYSFIFFLFFQIPSLFCFVSSYMGSFLSVCHAPPLLFLSLAHSLSALCPQIGSSLPPSLPLTLSFRFTWIQTHSELTCCSLHNTNLAVRSSCLAPFKVLYCNGILCLCV